MIISSVYTTGLTQCPGTTMQTVPEKVYRMKPWPLVFLYASIIGLLSIRWLQTSERGLSSPFFAQFFWQATAFVAVFVGICWKVFVVKLLPEGIRSTDGLGRYHMVRWEDIRSVRNICGFYYIQHGKIGAALMFPMFLWKARECRQDVILRTPPENPFRQFLQKSPSA